MGRTTNTTGIGVRNGTAQLGGLSTQPIPFVLPSTYPVARPTSPVTAVVAPANVADALTNGRIPELVIPVNNVINGTMDVGVRELFPTRLTALQYQPTSDSPSLRIVQAQLSTQRSLNDETLSLAELGVENNQFQPVGPNGINKLRPEIISLMDYEPIYYGDSSTLNDVGVLMDVQYQARVLREQTFLQLLRGIQQSDQSQQLQNIQSEFATSFQRINSSANFYQNTITALESTKNGFDLKTIPAGLFDIQNFSSLTDFYETFMLFPRTAMEKFSGTKILMQFLFDVRSIAEGYSMNLLDLNDPDRQANGTAFNSPVAIDRTYNNRNGFSFTYDTIKSFNHPINASENQFFSRFVTSLPQSPDDRVKVLVNMLSKELRVSRGLGRSQVVADLRQKFGATTSDGSPFDNLIGGVGSSIFERVTGPGSLASLAVVNDVAGSAVLPFETKYIDINNTKKVYIPGGSYFVDSIVNVAGLSSFNLSPLRSYVENFATTTDNVVSIATNLFDYSEDVSSLSPGEVLKQMLQGISNSLSYLMSNTQRSGLEINTADAATAAIFRLSAADPTLKSMLFQYVLLNLLSLSNSRFFNNAIVEELDNNITNLSFVTVNGDFALPDLNQKNLIQPFLTVLGGSIQNRVAELVNQQTLNGTNSAQTRDRADGQTDGKMLIGFDTDITFGIPAALNQSRFMTNFNRFVVGLENSLGNEINNILDGTKKTRFNSLSVTSLILMAFESYLNLICRFVRVDFQASSYGQNFPDMIVDTNFNAHMHDSIGDVILEPGRALPVVQSDDNLKPGDERREQTQRSSRNPRTVAADFTYNQIREAAQETGSSTGDVYLGLMENEAILAGSHATAGSRHTNGSQLARRRVSQRMPSRNLIDAQTMDRSLDSIMNKLEQEDFALACALHILLVIKQRLKTTLDVATNYFSQQTLDSFLSVNGTNISDVGKNLTVAQVRLLLRQRDSYIKSLTSNTNQIQFIPTSPTDLNTKNVILSLLKKAPFRESSDARVRYRLLTVGVPSGFSKNLVERLNGSSINSTSFQQNKDFDLVYVKVYKRSIEFPQIVFKPRKFMFDLSLFSNGYTNLDVTESDSFDSVMRKISLIDYQNPTTPTEINLENITTNNRYSLIPTTSERRQMFENHVFSDVFAAYMQALTGMKMAESSFVNTTSETWKRLSRGATNNDLSPQFAELARRYLVSQRTSDIRSNPALRPLPDVSIQEMAISPNVDQGTKDTLKLLSFGNVAFKLESALAEMLSPKLFERVFTIPLDIDGFEIDYEATTATESGREFFQKDFIQDKLDNSLPQGVYKFKNRTMKDVVLEDFFVTMELVG